MSLLTIACVATSFVIIARPLLQRASRVVPATITSNVTLNFRLPEELPYGFTGGYQNHELMYTKAGYMACKEFTEEDPIKFDLPDCKCSCYATINAPGIVRSNCSSQSWPITPSMMYEADATWGRWKTYGNDSDTPYTDNPAFYVSLNNGQVVGYPPGTTREAATLTMSLVHWVDFHGAFVETTCWLHSAILAYDVVFEGGTISLVDAAEGRVVALANNTHPANIAAVNTTQISTWDPFTGWLSMVVTANASVGKSTNPGINSTYSMDQRTYNAMVVKQMNLSDVAYEDLTFKDPTPTVISKYNELMLRGAVKAASHSDLASKFDLGVFVNQTVKARQKLTGPVFHSDLRWYAGAAMFELLTAFLILPMFWGWWQLGSNLTLSPLNLAVAFDAPLLRDVNSVSGSRGVVQQHGSMQLRFGAMLHTESPTGEQLVPDAIPGRLGFALERRRCPPSQRSAVYGMTMNPQDQSWM